MLHRNIDVVTQFLQLAWQSLYYTYILVLRVAMPFLFTVPQNLPVATLYGDVQIRFADWVRHLTHYDPSKWTCTSESAEEKVTVSLQSPSL